MPRLIKYLDGKNRGVREVICGSAFNLGISEIPGMVNMWGIYTTSKEANMYPKPIQDLSGWNVRSIACSTKASYELMAYWMMLHQLRIGFTVIVLNELLQGWTVACDDAVISCQPSPCYGELGNGEKKKSSAAVGTFSLIKRPILRANSD